MIATADPIGWHGTTVRFARRDGHVAMAADGQISFGQTAVNDNACRLHRIGSGAVLEPEGAIIESAGCRT